MPKGMLARHISLLAAALMGPLSVSAFPSVKAPPPPPAPSQSSAPANGAEWDSVPFSLLPLSLQRNPRVDLSVLTEMTPDGKKVTAATPSRPVYYIYHDSGLTQEGDIVAGEEPPAKEVLGQALQKALAVNGNLPATETHAPALIINFRWGSFNQLTFTQTGDDLELQNLTERAALVGGMSFAVQMMKAYTQGNPMLDAFRLQSARTNWLVDRAMGNLYFIIASAYDIEAAQQGKMKLLWRTKMSTSSRGVLMSETIPTLAVSSGAFFGREMPVSRLNRPVVKDGKVEIGTPTVKGYSDPSAPTTTSAPSTGK